MVRFLHCGGCGFIPLLFVRFFYLLSFLVSWLGGTVGVAAGGGGWAELGPTRQLAGWRGRTKGGVLAAW